MIYFFIRRLASLFLTLALSTVVIFVVMEIVPGDPALIILGTGVTEESLAALREQMGLNQPMATRYLQWVSGMLVGDFGVSYTYSVPVSELIAERVLVSLPLAIIALILSTLIAIPTGIIAAARRWQSHGHRHYGTDPAGHRSAQFLVGDIVGLYLCHLFKVSPRRRLSRLDMKASCRQSNRFFCRPLRWRYRKRQSCRGSPVRRFLRRWAKIISAPRGPKA